MKGFGDLDPSPEAIQGSHVLCKPNQILRSLGPVARESSTLLLERLVHIDQDRTARRSPGKIVGVEDVPATGESLSFPEARKSIDGGSVDATVHGMRVPGRMGEDHLGLELFQKS